jgi:hypothetical protein
MADDAFASCERRSIERGRRPPSTIGATRYTLMKYLVNYESYGLRAWKVRQNDRTFVVESP